MDRQSNIDLPLDFAFSHRLSQNTNFKESPLQNISSLQKKYSKPQVFLQNSLNRKSALVQATNEHHPLSDRQKEVIYKLQYLKDRERSKFTKIQTPFYCSLIQLITIASKSYLQLLPAYQNDFFQTIKKVFKPIINYPGYKQYGESVLDDLLSKLSSWGFVYQTQEKQDHFGNYIQEINEQMIRQL